MTAKIFVCIWVWRKPEKRYAKKLKNETVGSFCVFSNDQLNSLPLVTGSRNVAFLKTYFSSFAKEIVTVSSVIMARGPFLESPDNFSGPKSCFMFPVFAFKIKVSIILKMIKWNYQLIKQNWPVCELGTVLLVNRFWFQNLPSGPKSYRDFRDTGPRPKPKKLFCQKSRKPNVYRRRKPSTVQSTAKASHLSKNRESDPVTDRSSVTFYG